MKHQVKILLLGFVIFFPVFTSSAQSPVYEIPYFTFGSGVGIMPKDSLFLMNIRFRMQNRAAFTTASGSNLQVEDIEARVRRLRLRLDGFVYDKRITYIIQLSFSRGDMDLEAIQIPNIVRDAMVFYKVNPHLTLGLGQTKLPGNRQRVNSSGDLQLADRSIVNALFNIDRDFGIQGYYRNRIQGLHYFLRGAISTGEGRNILESDNGLAYTGRLELLPLGIFEREGDYFEGDLMRETTPKLSLAMTYNYNQNAIRTGGQLGRFLYEPRSFRTLMFDGLLKYRGLALAVEYIERNTILSPLTSNELGDITCIYTGTGNNYQGSYLFKNNLEVIGRYSKVEPFQELMDFENETEQYTVGLTRYIKGHRLKIQSDLTYEVRTDIATSTFFRDNWQLRFQVELGI